jgi:preprotein translocase subunit SecA
MMGRLGMQEGEDIQHPLLTRAIENAQRKVEAMNFDIRKQLLEFDNVMNKQREMVYSLRNELLDGKNVGPTIQSMMSEALGEKLEQWIPPKVLPETWDTASFHGWLVHTFGQDGGRDAAEWAKLSRPEVEDASKEVAGNAYAARAQELGEDIFQQLQRMILLQMIDVAWKEHLYDLDQLKKGINLRAYAQKDPLIEFQREAFNLFTQMMNRIREQTVEYIFKVQIQQGPAEDSQASESSPKGPSPLTPKSVFRGARAEKPEFEGPAATANADPLPIPSAKPAQRDLFPVSADEEDGTPRMKVSAPAKIGRNDPCFCGSGKKFKKCHGA